MSGRLSGRDVTEPPACVGALSSEWVPACNRNRTRACGDTAMTRGGTKKRVGLYARGRMSVRLRREGVRCQGTMPQNLAASYIPQIPTVFVQSCTRFTLSTMSLLGIGSQPP